MTIFLAKQFFWVCLMRLTRICGKKLEKMKVFTFLLILLRKSDNFAYFSTSTT
jgi:hypothetical protein